MNNNIISTKNIADTFVTEDQFQNYISCIHDHINYLNDGLRDTNNSLLHKIANLRKFLIAFGIIQTITIALFSLHLYLLH